MFLVKCLNTSSSEIFKRGQILDLKAKRIDRIQKDQKHTLHEVRTTKNTLLILKWVKMKREQKLKTLAKSTGQQEVIQIWGIKLTQRLIHLSCNLPLKVKTIEFFIKTISTQIYLKYQETTQVWGIIQAREKTVQFSNLDGQRILISQK